MSALVSSAMGSEAGSAAILAAPSSRESAIGLLNFSSISCGQDGRAPSGAAGGGEHRGWHSRGYLPHFDEAGLIQLITFRLADSIPKERLETLEFELKVFPEKRRESRRRRSIEKMLDRGFGRCCLSDPRAASIVEDALLFFDGLRYRLLRWVVMPNHVHSLIEEMAGFPLGDILHSWKSFTSKEINRFFARRGRLWMPDYFDRYIRDERHLAAAIRYIDENPAKAGLVRRPEEWPFSSAGSPPGSAGILPARE